MKRTTQILMLMLLAIFLTAGQTWAESFSFTGTYTISDSMPDSSYFKQTVSLDNGGISVFDPLDDGLFADTGNLPPYWEIVEFPTLFLDESRYISGVKYDFDPTTYLEGFKVYDHDTTLLFQADLTVDSLVVDGSTGSINPAFSMNLTNITAGGSYTAGSSIIVDTFLDAPGGATNITLQIAATNLAAQIENVDNQYPDDIFGTYSGSAAATVPEPATMLLLGAGLIGLAGISRKKLVKR